jgi:segregation and condensation protein A
MTSTMTSEPRDPALPGEPGLAGEPAPAGGGFQVHLDVFEGPFDLLLGLISKHKLDITEIALSSVTDEFIAYIRALAGGWDLDQASYFLVVAATLLDLKAARLLPAGEVDDEEDLALLEARDLLFARLLQYRAYREVAAVLSGRMTAEARRFPRRVPMEPRFADLLPEVLIGLGPAEFAAIAGRVLAPRRPPTVSTAHLHVPRTSVREQAEILLARLRSLRRATFRQLIADCAGTYEIVARFLAVLELYRDGRVALDQVAPLGDLYVSWVDRPATGGSPAASRPGVERESGPERASGPERESGPERVPDEDGQARRARAGQGEEDDRDDA